MRRGLRVPTDMPIATEEDLWTWAMRQGDATRLVAYLVFGMLGAEGADWPGWRTLRNEARPIRIAWALDHIERALIADMIVAPGAYMR